METIAESKRNNCFSPVAGIQWVETSDKPPPIVPGLLVSVPLPGFSGLRPSLVDFLPKLMVGFSPVAGIQWVETF